MHGSERCLDGVSLDIFVVLVEFKLNNVNPEVLLILFRCTQSLSACSRCQQWRNLATCKALHSSKVSENLAQVHT